MVNAGFEIVEHTADVGIVSHGPTIADAFEQAARGLYSLMIDLGRVEPLVAREITAEAPDRERLLVRWLSDLIFLTESEALVFASFEVDVAPDGRSLRALAQGEPLDMARHDPGYDVKAVTYHDLEVVEEPSGWRCRVIVDV
jgi:SHS2 domain-containing protein